MATIKSRAIHHLVNSVPLWSRSAHRTMAKVRRGGGTIDFYWAPACPYSYVMAQQLKRLSSGSELEVRVRHVPLGSADVDPVPELRRSHGPRDCATLAEFYDIDFPNDWTVPTEKAVNLANRVVDRALSLEACISLGHCLWRGDVEGQAKIAAECGLAPAALAQDSLARNKETQRKKGHYHPGTVLYLGEWFEGPMRMEVLAELVASDGHTAAPPWSRQSTQANASASPCVPIEMWFSFRSPYAYLAIAQLQQWRKTGENFEVLFRPVLPMVMQGFPVPSRKKMYIVRDAAREARRLGIPFGLIADPLGIGAERCLAVCAALYRHSPNTEQAFDFAVAASAGIWSEGIDVASNDGLMLLASRAAIAPDIVNTAVQDLDAGISMAESNRALLVDAGVWGVPSFRCGNFVTWGQDRLEMVRHHAGLRALPDLRQ